MCRLLVLITINQSQGTSLHGIQSLYVGGSTLHPCQGTVLHIQLYLCLVHGEDAVGVEVACHPMEGRDTPGSLCCDGGNMVVETQATVNGHSQDLDVLLEWQTLVPKSTSSLRQLGR